MKKSPAFQMLLLFAVSLFISCSGNSLSERCGSSWSPSAELADEIEALSEALQAYSQDQSTENCEAYKEAYLDYLDGLRDWEDCYVYAYSKDEFNQAIDDVEESINDLECN